MVGCSLPRVWNGISTDIIDTDRYRAVYDKVFVRLFDPMAGIGLLRHMLRKNTCQLAQGPIYRPGPGTYSADRYS